MEITKREILVSIAIFLVLLSATICGNIAIVDHFESKNEVYTKALRIDTPDLFKYAMETNAGNAYVSLEIKAKESQKHKNLNEEYISIREYVEEYSMKTRIVTHIDSDGETYTTTETYWDWDWIETNYIQPETILVNGLEMDYEKLSNLPFNSVNLKNFASKEHDGKISYDGSYIEIDKLFQNKRRYSYKVVELNFNAVALVNFDNTTIQPFSGNSIIIYKNMTIEELYKKNISNYKIKIFGLWFGFAILVIGLITMFYVLDNRWLNNEKD